MPACLCPLPEPDVQLAALHICTTLDVASRAARRLRTYILIVPRDKRPQQADTGDPVAVIKRNTTQYACFAVLNRMLQELSPRMPLLPNAMLIDPEHQHHQSSI